MKFAFTPTKGMVNLTDQVTFLGRWFILACCGCLLAFGILAYGAVHPWAYYPLGLITAGLSLLALAWGLFLWFAGPASLITWPRPPLWGAAIGFGLLVFLQLLPLPQGLVIRISPVALQIRALGNGYGLADFVPLSLNPYATQLEFLKLWPAVVVFYLLIYTVNSRQQILGLVWLILGVALFEMVYGFWHLRTRLIWGWRNPLGNFRLCGTFINPNHLAAFLTMAALLGLGLFLAQGKRSFLSSTMALSPLKRFKLWTRGENLEPLLSHFPLLLAVFMLIVALIFTGSRAGMISLGVGLVQLGFMIHSEKSRKGFIFIAGILLIAAVLYSLLLSSQPHLGRLLDLEDKGRYLTMRGALSIWLEFPWVGAGLGTFGEMFYRLEPAGTPAVLYLYAHSDWLQLLAETEACGFLLLSVAWVWFFGGLFKGWQKQRDAFARGLGLGIIPALGAGAFHALAEFHFHVPGFAFMYAALAAIAYLVFRLPDRGSDVPATSPDISSHRSTVAVVLVLLLLVQLSLSYKAWFWWQAESLSPTEIDSTREPWFPVKTDFRQSLIDNPANAHYYLGQAEALENSNFEDLKLLAEVDGLLRSAIFRAPADWANRLRVGEVYLRAFRIAPSQCIPKALKELAAAVQLFPASGLLQLRLGKVLAWAEHNHPGSVPVDLRGLAGFHIKEALRLDPHLKKSLGPEEPSSSAP